MALTLQMPQVVASSKRLDTEDPSISFQRSCMDIPGVLIPDHQRKEGERECVCVGGVGGT